jgi:hypothetical protein
MIERGSVTGTLTVILFTLLLFITTLKRTKGPGCDYPMIMHRYWLALVQAYLKEQKI